MGIAAQGFSKPTDKLPGPGVVFVTETSGGLTWCLGINDQAVLAIEFPGKLPRILSGAALRGPFAVPAGKFEVRPLGEHRGLGGRERAPGDLIVDEGGKVYLLAEYHRPGLAEPEWTAVDLDTGEAGNAVGLSYPKWELVQIIRDKETPILPKAQPRPPMRISDEALERSRERSEF